MQLHQFCAEVIPFMTAWHQIDIKRDSESLDGKTWSQQERAKCHSNPKRFRAYFAI